MGVSSGIAMDIHYCMGQKAGFDFYGSSDENCGKCCMNEKKGCCNDNHQFYKLNDSHKNISNDLQFGAPFTIISSIFLPHYSVSITDIATLAYNNHSPPDYTGPSTLILNCIFRL